MAFTVTSEALARSIADRLNADAERLGLGCSCQYRAEIHNITLQRWGVSYWFKYADRHDLGWVFGRFLWKPWEHEVSL